MPYKIVKVDGGFKVKKDTLGHPKYFSYHPLSYETALKQLKVLYYSENK